MVTWEMSSQLSPSSTSPPMTQNGPTWQESGTRALGSTMALGWIKTWAYLGCGRSTMWQLMVASQTSLSAT